MADYYDDETWRDRANLQQSHPDEKDIAFDRGYALGLKHGIEKERAEWMTKIGDAVIEALREATSPGDW